MIRSYLPIVILFAIALVFISVSFLASTLLGPRRRTMAKTAPYECGIVPETDSQRRFGVKFYLLAIAFIILDVEIIFLYPFSTVFVDRVVNGSVVEGLGTSGIILMGIFLTVLLVPFAYLLASGALNFGPNSPKVSTLLVSISRSQGFDRDISGTSTDTVSPSLSMESPSEPEVFPGTANASEEVPSPSKESGDE